jgi:hypothetical protein
MIICNQCKIPKHEDEFYKSSITKRHYLCGLCSVIRNKQRRKTKQAQNDTHARFMYAKNSAKSTNKPFLIPEEEYCRMIASGCHYCQRKIKDFGIGLDRINNDKSIGYTLENVLPCCGTCNKIKGIALTVEETEVAIKAVLKFRKNQLK